MDKSSVDRQPRPLRERKKEATRRALVRAANRRFHQFGFESTTIDDICDDVGISRRTFFRYFANKEALAFPHRGERLERFVAMLQNAPARESPFASLRRVAQVLAFAYADNREQLLAQQRLIDQTPSLSAREHEIDRDWEQAMAAVFLQRFAGDPNAELRAQMLAGAAIGLIRATLRYWFEQEGRPDLGELGKQALDALQKGFLAEK
ncbi:MAG: TetR family transcriptional regulator [Xanthomonadales bacterium]|nr:TetR family transcriptional regulator [Xanthomonadales bacterium]